MTENSKPISIKIVNLYKKTSKKGTTYWQGPLGLVKVTLFENQRWQSDQDPVFTLHISPMENYENSQARSKSSGYQNRQQNFAPNANVNREDDGF